MPMPSVMRSTPAPAGLITVDGKTFPLLKAEIHSRAEGGIAATQLHQTYRNPHREPLEAVYTLPLPADGAVIAYTIRMGERIIRGVVESREAAQEKYRKALEEGRVGGLLEQERSDTFTQTLGNLPPGEQAEVEIEVLHPLAFRSAAAGEPAHWEYRFPTVVGVRYEGEPGRVEDSAKLDVDRADSTGTPVRLEMELLVGDGTPQAIAAKSPTHSILVEAVNGGSRVSLSEGAPLDRDLVVCWCPLKQEVGVQLIEGQGLPGDEGRYAWLAIMPPTRAGEFHGRDLTLLIDASGSMQGKPLALAKAVAGDLLKSLGPRDRFEVLAFSIEIQVLVKGPVEATERNVRRALKELDGLRAGGGTEMAGAVLDALRPLRVESQRQVILITDGYVGFEQQVTRSLLRNLPSGARLHTVGIGSAPNRTLTRWTARAGRGVELILGEQSAAPAVSERLRQATVAPILTDVMLSGSALAGMAPARPRDLFEGQPLGVALRLNPQGGSLEVRARMAGGRDTWIQQLPMEPHPQDRSQARTSDPTHLFGKAGRLPLGALYGREAIEDCEMELAACSPREAERIEGEIEALGLRHRIASRRTSLVAVAEEPSVDPQEARRRRHLAVELPQDVSAEGTGLLATPGDELLMRGGLDVDLRRSLFLNATFGISKAGLKRDRPKIKGLDPEALACEILDPARFIPGEIVRLENDLMFVEFDSPADGFMLPGPGDELRMTLLFRRPLQIVEVNLVQSQSTRRGPHARGLRLRLVLRRKDGSAWNITGRFTTTIQWYGPDAREVTILIMREGPDGAAA